MNLILKIGDFSRINNISIQTLRYYDKIGLLSPYSIDKETGYRYYHINQSQIVDEIQYLRQLDFSLEEIRAILSTQENMTEINHFINEHRQHLLSEKHRLEERLKEIDTFQTGAQIYDYKRHCHDLEILSLPARRMIIYQTQQNIYQMTDEDYEFHLREFKLALKKSKLSYSIFSRVGSIIAQKDFKNRNWLSHQMFMFSNDEAADFAIKTYPSSLYALTYCTSFQEEIEKLDLFYQMIINKGYDITGDYICEVIHEHPRLNQNKRDMFIRMQVAIKQTENKNGF